MLRRKFLLFKMTTIMAQATGTLFNETFEETKWKAHLTSTIHVKNGQKADEEIAMKFFEMSFDASLEKEERMNLLKNEKTHIYFATKLSKEKLW